MSIRRILLFLLSLLVIAGCAGSYGRLQRSREADEIFKKNQVLPDHKYYFAGPEGRPDAILGIHRDFILETTQWTEFEATSELLKKWVDWLNFHFDRNVRYYPYGSFILNPAGRRAGIWYSIWDWTPVIMKGNNRIEVYPPIRPDPLDDPGDDFDKKKRF